MIARHILALVFLSAVLTAVSAHAQSTVVKVRVTDSTGHPLSDADVVVVQDSGGAVALGRTDAAGQHTFFLDLDAVPYQLAARKVGYAKGSRPIHAAPGDTLAIELSLARLPPSLDTVRAVAVELPLNKRPYLDAEEIARDTRGIFSLEDVLVKLRRNVAYQSSKCMGRPLMGRMVLGSIPGPHMWHFLSVTVYVNGRAIPADWDPWHSIHSEHIAEVRYVNCFDNSIPGLASHPWASLYVALKPGIGWNLSRGSYVVHPDSGSIR